MRFLIEVDEQWNVTISSPSRKDDKPLTRQMRKIPWSDGGYIPAPPEADLTEEHLRRCSLCKAENSAEVKDLYQSIRDRRPLDQGADLFGHYLFEVLLGEDKIWAAIKQIAEEEHEQLIELALDLPEQGDCLGWLPWEMMRSKDNFLIAGSGQTTVAITRLVPKVEISPHQIQLPPRVLFIVGTTLDDPTVKPGAEYMSLLRQLKCNGYNIHSRVVEKAKRGDIMNAVLSFKPDVVYFICHGDIDSDGNPYLELTLQDANEQYPTGEQIAELLRFKQDDKDRYPSIVVLSACHSATEGENGQLHGPHVTAPLAVQMVRKGVPIVIGMAGQISDFACRIFTRRFGMALVEGEPLIAATALARRAAFAEGLPPHTNVDWAFPVLYLAKSVDSQYVPVQPGQVDPDEQMQRWIDDYNIEQNPVFCGREEFFQEYYKFFVGKNKVQVLAIEAPQNSSGYGKTRLLQELTMQALRDGHVPCLLSSNPGDWLPPKDIAELGRRLSKAILNVRSTFTIGPPPPDSQLILLKRYASSIEELQNQPALNPYIQSLLLQGEAATSPQVVAIAIQQDLVRLARDIHEKEPLTQQKQGRIIVLLDAVDTYHQVIADLCNRELMGPYALGPNGLGSTDETVPVVLAYSKPTTPTNLQNLLEKNPPWLVRRPLEAFRRKEGYGEDVLAYETLLLHYEDEMGEPMPLVVDEEKLKDRLLFWDAAYLAMEGIPGIIVNGGLHKFVGFGQKKWKYLSEANDNVFWNNWMRQLEKMK